MKKIVFITLSMDSNGAEKSLISLLSKLDYTKYDIDLMLINPTLNFFTNDIPEQVNLIEMPKIFHDIHKPIKQSIRCLLKKREFKWVFYRLILAITKNLKIKTKLQQFLWRKMVPNLPHFEKQYDFSISYQDYFPAEFMLEKINAKKYIGWNHNNYTDQQRSKLIDKSQFERLDYVITISSECKKTLINNFRDIEKKLHVIPNVIDVNEILTKSNEKSDDLNEKYRGIYILSIGRLVHQKGFDMVIEVCKQLKLLGYDFKWHIIGEGPDEGILHKLIKENNLEDTLILLGRRKNPYMYIKRCDIYAQPSRYEGFGIALAEARVLKKTIVATDLDVFKEQITHELNGLLIPFNSNQWIETLSRLFEQKNLMTELSSNVIIPCSDESINKLDKLLE